MGKNAPATKGGFWCWRRRGHRRPWACCSGGCCRMGSGRKKPFSTVHPPVDAATGPRGLWLSGPYHAGRPHVAMLQIPSCPWECLRGQLEESGGFLQEQTHTTLAYGGRPSPPSLVAAGHTYSGIVHSEQLFMVPLRAHTYVYTLVTHMIPEAVLLGRRNPGPTEEGEEGSVRERACVLFLRWTLHPVRMKPGQRGASSVSVPAPSCHLLHYVGLSPTLYVVVKQEAWGPSRRWRLYMRINCTVSFQYILLYILVSFPFSSLLIRGMWIVQCPAG